MVTETIKNGRKVVNVELSVDAESYLEILYALVRSIGLNDVDAPLTPDDLYRISSLIEDMLPTIEQINISANYQAESSIAV